MHTTNPVARLFIFLLPEVLYPDFPLPNPMRFIPVKFRHHYRIIGEPILAIPLLFRHRPEP
jgi:hypothetical protein